MASTEECFQELFEGCGLYREEASVREKGWENMQEDFEGDAIKVVDTMLQVKDHGLVFRTYRIRACLESENKG